MRPKIHLAQCLCPQRHCIVAIGFIPGETAAQNEARDGDIILTIENAGPYLLALIKNAAATGALNPFCGICKAPIEQFHCEVGATKFRSMEEAMPFLRASEIAQRRSAEMLKNSRN